MPTRAIQRFRETVNLAIYGSKATVLQVLRVLRLFMALVSISAFLYFIGYPQTETSRFWILALVRSSIVFFIFSYLLRFFYDFEPARFFRENALEGLLLLAVVLDVTGILVVGKPFLRFFLYQSGLVAIDGLFLLVVQLFLLFIVMLDLVKAGKHIARLRIKPSTLFVGSYLILIFGGAALLTMPEMHAAGTVLSFTDAIFTAASAACVTGLTVVDTATFFTLKGKLVLMTLIQLGGLNIIIFASFFALLSGRSAIGLRQQAIVMDFMSFESLSNTVRMLRDILLVTLAFETLGTFLLFFTWGADVSFRDGWQRLWFSFFHSVSAFNNAGFSLFSQNLAAEGVRHSYTFHLVIAALVIVGGIGFPVIQDLLGIGPLRERLHKPWKKPRVHTRLVVNASLLLIVAGTLVFYFFEIRNPAQYAVNGIVYQNDFQKLITAFFHSVSARTAGFNTLDVGILSAPVLLFFCFLMFVGASPISTGGGVKTTTMSILLFSGLASVRNKKHIEIFHYQVSPDLARKSFGIVFFSGCVVFIGTFLLMIFEPHLPPLNVFFEMVSAHATVGLSTGITAGLSVPSKWVLIAAMFMGRVGILTLAVSLARPALTNRYALPEANIIVA
jgi:potassium uptake TrkH family protein